MKVRLVFTVSKNALPALLIVRESCGKVVLCRKIYGRLNVLSFCPKNANFAVTLRPYDADFCRRTYFFGVGLRDCATIRIGFIFTAKETAALQTFTLLDGNYMFPIKTADLLFFKNG